MIGNEPSIETRTPSRSDIGAAAALMLVAVVIGATTVSQPHWVSTLESLAGAGGVVAGIGQTGGNQWTRRTRWSVLGAGVLLAGALGLLIRMVAHGLMLRGR